MIALQYQIEFHIVFVDIIIYYRLHWLISLNLQINCSIIFILLFPSSIPTRSDRNIPVYGIKGGCASRCNLRRFPILLRVLNITLISSNRARCLAGTYVHACANLCITADESAK
eukprot:TRINITY_DN6956_c0_g1_i1.p1 TRINITY_DN6956_c0_g1~~TRINITY_DN6956_c0_g1_i1.p1  ORF type:complete len:114 (-),score=2.18 TRINITY_DN6956_c0_g1_i1:253-594(-)